MKLAGYIIVLYITYYSYISYGYTPCVSKAGLKFPERFLRCMCTHTISKITRTTRITIITRTAMIMPAIAPPLRESSSSLVLGDGVGVPVGSGSI